MTSYASGGTSASRSGGGINLDQYRGANSTGFGAAAYQRARAAGLSDAQISGALQKSGMNVGARAGQSLGIQPRSSGSAASGGFNTLAGMMTNSGQQGLVGLMNKFPTNSVIGTNVVGALADSFKTQADMGADLFYQRAMMGTLAEHQYGLENLRAGNALKLTAAEGAIQKDVAQLNADTSLGLGRLSLEGTKYTADKSLQASNYSADRSLDSAKYVSDRNLEGTKYVADESTRRVRVQGDEDRKTLGESTLQTLRLRQDARRSINNVGSRFYA